jgi:hypothetical protein
MTNQISVVAILMIIQGALESLAGLLVGVAAFIFPELIRSMNFIVRQQQRQLPPGQAVAEFPEEFGYLIAAIYLAIGAGAFLAGVLKIIAGARNLQYRGRVFGIVALCCGILAFPLCYCAPTGLGLMIYGLIVYSQGDVGKAFAMAGQGRSPQEIRDYFTRKAARRVLQQYEGEETGRRKPPPRTGESPQADEPDERIEDG